MITQQMPQWTWGVIKMRGAHYSVVMLDNISIEIRKIVTTIDAPKPHILALGTAYGRRTSS